MGRTETIQRVVNSAEWAAYGDALGFITELASESAITWRYGQPQVKRLGQWRRKIGGISGTEIELPTGVYSDDTQLRIATARAINPEGYFDIEAFAKVELPIWLSYSLGAGRGTKTAAANLSRQDTNWFSNFFNKKGSDYLNGGGNGAAMRIQPHVWSNTKNLDNDAIILDVIRNSITTHGHPRGFLGAVFHAHCLRLVLLNGQVPGPDEWISICNNLSDIPRIIKDDYELYPFWLPMWEKLSKTKIEDSVSSFQTELRGQIDLTNKILERKIGHDEKYTLLLEYLGGNSPSTRGSGSLTALVASAAAWLFREQSLSELMILIVNSIDSDTDTIATMAGAIGGAATTEPPLQEVLDKEYIKKQAYSLAVGNENKETTAFPYPDLSKWRSPKSQSSALEIVGNRYYIAGLGYLSQISNPIIDKRNSKLCWQWFKLDFGQTILVKTNRDIISLEKDNGSTKSSITHNELPYSADRQTQLEIDINEKDGKKTVSGNTVAIKIDIDELSSQAIKSGFEKHLIGEHLLLIADSEKSIELSVAYAAVIAKARISRNKHNKN